MKKAIAYSMLVAIFAMILIFVKEEAGEWKPDKPKDMATAEMRLTLIIQNLKSVSDEIKNSTALTKERRESLMRDLGVARGELDSLKEDLGDITFRYKNELQKYLENLNREFYSKEKVTNEGVIISLEELCEDMSHVVHIEALAAGPMGYQRAGGGAGVMIDIESKPFVLTVAHLIHPNYIYEAIRGGRHRAEPIEMVGYDPVEDLSLFKFSNPDFVHDGRFAELGESSELKIGTPIVSIGSPAGVKFLPTCGIVSKLDLGYFSEWADRALTLNQPQVIGHTAEISPGNSGGPLISLKTGKVVGINSMMLWDSRPFNHPQYLEPPARSISIAIPSDDIIKILPKLIKGGEVEHGVVRELMVGNSWEFSERDFLNMDMKLPTIDGPIVLQIVADDKTPAAGFQLGDIIKSVDDVTVSSYHEYYLKILHMNPGETVNIKVIRETIVGAETKLEEIEIETPVVKFKSR